MPVNVRWITVKGKQLLSVHLPHGGFFTASPGTAQELITELTRALMTPPPTGPDDGGHGYR